MEKLETMSKLVDQMVAKKDLGKVQAFAFNLQIMSIGCQYRLLEGMAVQNGLLERQAKALESIAQSAIAMEPH